MPDRRRFRLLCVVCAFSLVLGFLGPQRGHAQSGPAPDSVDTWTYELASKLSGSQAAYKDWQEGGLNTLSFTASVDGTAKRTTNQWTQVHELRLAFGLITSQDDEEGEPLRKADDKIRAQSNFRYKGDGFFRHFKPTVSARLRTQFAKGFDYSEDPLVQTSEFFAPAYLVQTLGLTYAPKDWYTVRLGAASKQTVVKDRELRSLYDVDPNSSARVEAGAELVGSMNREIAPNVRYKTSAIFFLAVNQVEEPPDMLWENYVTMQVNSWLTANLEFVALFDQNTSDALQLKEVISLGVTMTLL